MRRTYAALMLALGVGCSGAEAPPYMSGPLGAAAGSGPGPAVTGPVAPGVPGVGQPPVSPGGSMVTGLPPAAVPGAPGLPMGNPGVVPPTAAQGEWFEDEPISKECQGLDFSSMMYSPGGTTLPDKCHPFHPTFNNPYAIRCIDAWPSYKSGFPGDEYCLLPPPPNLGTQLGYHPQEAAYADQVAKGDMSGYTSATGNFILAARDEDTSNYRALHTTDAEHNYYRIYYRMRTGSHHNIITIHTNRDRGGWAPPCGLLEGTTACDPPGFISGDFAGVLGGQQRPDDNVPATLEKPVEDKGLYLVLPKDPTILFNLHHFNGMDRTLLKESWINVWWENEDATKRLYWMMGLELGQAIPNSDFELRAGEIKDFHYQWNATTDYRITSLLGHRHLWTTNFSAWIERQGDPNNVEIIYQSFDWLDMPTYRYDSAVKNPPVNAMKRRDGAFSGVVEVKRGDSVHFNCHQEFTNERREASGMDVPPVEEIRQTKFANEIYSGEMCILFGTATENNVVTGLPSRSRAPAPAFAK